MDVKFRSGEVRDSGYKISKEFKGVTKYEGVKVQHIRQKGLIRYRKKCLFSFTVGVKVFS